MFTSTVIWLPTAPVNAGGDAGQELEFEAIQTCPGAGFLNVAVTAFSVSVLCLLAMLTQVVVPAMLLGVQPDWKPIVVPNVCPTM